MVTHEKASRYFMSIPEAVGLVLKSAAIGSNKDRFILDMGKPVRIMDLAQGMIRLSGYEAGKDIEIRCTGLKKGEKLHEELNAADEQLTDTDHPKIKRIKGGELSSEQWQSLKTKLEERENLQASEAEEWLRKLLPEFRSE